MVGCVRGIRGAVTVRKNSAGDILSATRELLEEIVDRNDLEIKEISAVFFSMTTDLNAVFPAAAAREIGWSAVPLFCSQEIEVPGSLPYCIRALMLVNTSKGQADLHHVYLRGASKLRPDFVSNNT